MNKSGVILIIVSFLLLVSSSEGGRKVKYYLGSILESNLHVFRLWTLAENIKNATEELFIMGAIVRVAEFCLVIHFCLSHGKHGVTLQLELVLALMNN